MTYTLPPPKHRKIGLIYSDNDMYAVAFEHLCLLPVWRIACSLCQLEPWICVENWPAVFPKHLFFCSWAVKLSLGDTAGEESLTKKIQWVAVNPKPIGNRFEKQQRHKRWNLIMQEQKHWPSVLLTPYFNISKNARRHVSSTRRWTKHGCQRQTGWCVCFANCWSTGIFMHHHVKSFWRIASRKQFPERNRLADGGCLFKTATQTRHQFKDYDENKIQPRSFIVLASTCRMQRLGWMYIFPCVVAVLCAAWLC